MSISAIPPTQSPPHGESPSLAASSPPTSSLSPRPPSSDLLNLPFELLEAIVLNLPAYEAAKFGQTCRKFQRVVDSDVHWKKRVVELGLTLSSVSPKPFDSWKHLFLAHYPYWFIPQHKVWFADGTELDGGLCGQLVVARFHPYTGNIDGYALVGEQGQTLIYPWTEMPGVNIHEFKPRVRLHLAQPIFSLRGFPADSPGPSPLGVNGGAQGEREAVGLRSIRPASNLLNEAHRVFAEVMLARAIAPKLQHPSMSLWPPPRIPAIDRVRRQTTSVWSYGRMHGRAMESSKGASFDRPTTHDEVCHSAFRFQRQVGGRITALFEMLNQGGPAMLLGDARAAMAAMPLGVGTYSTLPPEAYTPTAERPYQGIWVGDYAGHGCEFLLVQQKITRQEIRSSEFFGPQHNQDLNTPHNQHNSYDEDSDGLSLRSADDESEHGPTSEAEVYEDGSEHPDAPNSPDQAAASRTRQSSSSPSATAATTADQSRQRKRRRSHSIANSMPPFDGKLGETGRLEAIKLTGDPNIPRGEFTFVAEDIGPDGQIYVGQTDVFKDKRAVSCWGHIADRQFTNDVFVKTDLILVSHDCLAQYWPHFGHVAFYRRIDLARFFDPLAEPVELTF